MISSRGRRATCFFRNGMGNATGCARQSIKPTRCTTSCSIDSMGFQRDHMINVSPRLIAAFSFSVVAASVAIGASGDDARYSAPLPWKKPRLSRVFAVGYTDLGTNGRGTSEVKTINGQSCVVGPTLGFDIDDAYAFDIDEPVELALTYVPAQTTAQTLVVLFDKSGGDGRGSIEVTPDRSGATAEAKLR